jgi:hypothetical protein
MTDKPQSDSVARPQGVHSTKEPERAATTDVSSYCPNCGSHMCESRCKLVCKTCGFFLSCSDFY